MVLAIIPSSCTIERVCQWHCSVFQSIVWWSVLFCSCVNDVSSQKDLYFCQLCFTDCACKWESHFSVNFVIHVHSHVGTWPRFQTKHYIRKRDWGIGPLQSDWKRFSAAIVIRCCLVAPKGVGCSFYDDMSGVSHISYLYMVIVIILMHRLPTAESYWSRLPLVGCKWQRCLLRNTQRDQTHCTTLWSS